MMALLGMLPVIGNLVLGVFNKWQDTKVQIFARKIGADENVAREILQTQAKLDANRIGFLQAVAASPILSFIVLMFAIPPIAFEWKVVLWDTMLGLGVTYPVGGQVADWMQTILYGIFGVGSVMGFSAVWAKSRAST